jgi:hypothetical protein
LPKEPVIMARNTPERQPAACRAARTRDLRSGREHVRWFSLAIVVLLIVTAAWPLPCWAVFASPTRRAAPVVEGPASAPTLQSAPQDELRTYRRAKAAALEGYRWIDRRGGVVQIPIERAMEMVAAQAPAPHGDQTAESANPATEADRAAASPKGQTMKALSLCGWPSLWPGLDQPLAATRAPAPALAARFTGKADFVSTWTSELPGDLVFRDETCSAVRLATTWAGARWVWSFPTTAARICVQRRSATWPNAWPRRPAPPRRNAPVLVVSIDPLDSPALADRAKHKFLDNLLSPERAAALAFSEWRAGRHRPSHRVARLFAMATTQRRASTPTRPALP